MRILFSGPTLPRSEAARLAPEVVWRSPARQGDVARAVLDGAGAIGLVDGLYGDVAAVWHKEILFALDRGVAVMGAASIGALRAAECAAFGMVGVGAVFQRYAAGELDDDAAVAQLHAPAELDFAPLTEALVNVEATLERLADRALLTPREVGALLAAARALFFGERTYARIVELAAPGTAEAQAGLVRLVQAHAVDVKRQDACLMLAQLAGAPATPAGRPGWRMAETHVWRRMLDELQAGNGAGDQITFV